MTVTMARAGTEQRVAMLCEAALEEMGYRLVRVRYVIQSKPVRSSRHYKKATKKTGKNHLLTENFGQMQLMIERIDGSILDVEDCAKVHRHVSTLLDVDDPVDHSFQLEVSSPGIQRPLTKNNDFTYYRGFDVDISLLHLHEGRRRVKGKINEVQAETVEIIQDNQQTIVLPLSSIGEARLQFNQKN